MARENVHTMCDIPDNWLNKKVYREMIPHLDTEEMDQFEANHADRWIFHSKEFGF
jgi:hypothetical protein